MKRIGHISLSQREYARRFHSVDSVERLCSDAGRLVILFHIAKTQESLSVS